MRLKQSHINHAAYDSQWEATEAYELDQNQNVESWVKNDHLGFKRTPDQTTLPTNPQSQGSTSPAKQEQIALQPSTLKLGIHYNW